MFAKLFVGQREFQSFIKNRIARNMLWLFLDKLCKLGVGLIVGVWVARYLGPEKFGKWNYAIAIVSLFAAFSTLGLEQVLVKNFVGSENRSDKLIGTAFFLRLIGSSVAVAITTFYIFFSTYNPDIVLLVFISGLNLVFQSLDVIDLKLQSVLNSKVAVIVKNSSFIIGSILKLLVIYKKGPLVYFVLITLFEVILGSFGLVLYYGINKFLKWRLYYITAKDLLSECWPLIFSGFIIILYMRLDQVMIAQMLNTKAVGLYSVSVKFSELWYFIPTVVVSSFFPKMIEIFADRKAYFKVCLFILKIFFLSSFVIAIILSIISDKLILFLYGSHFIPAAFALKISIWTAIFVFWGVCAGNMLVIENLNKHNLYKSIQGLIINISLNIFLIPKMGINGAAIATLISQFYASYLYYLFPKETRHIFLLQTRSILFFI